MGSVLYSGFRHEHHNAGSGYDLVVPDGEPYVCGNELWFGKKKVGTKWRSLNFLLVDLITLFRGLSCQTIHYIYPENTAYFSAILLHFLGKKIVFTVHLNDDFWLGEPPSLFYKLKQLNLKFADSIIALSLAQATRLKEVFPGKSVIFLHHGLAFNKSAPSDDAILARRANKRIVVVGSNYRDFDVLREIAKGLAERNVTLHLIGTGLSKTDFPEAVDEVIVHGRLSFDVYDALLLGSFAMLLPLTFATANNALLEAHKFAVPVFCSDIEGVSDYANSSTILFRTAADFWVNFDRLANSSPEEYVRFCTDGHNNAAAMFDWPVLREKTTSSYRN